MKHTSIKKPAASREVSKPKASKQEVSRSRNGQTHGGFKTQPAAGLKGELEMVPDKSISHRAVVLASLAKGPSVIDKLSLCDDVLRTLKIMEQLGVELLPRVSVIKEGDTITICGKGLGRYESPSQVLFCGNSGTTMRLMLGVLAGQNFACSVTGDISLSQRPMERVLSPLKKMGAAFELRGKGLNRRITTRPNHDKRIPFLRGIDFDSPIASAQIKSAVLLAALHATTPTTITEPSLSRDHTERMLSAMGACISHKGCKVSIAPGPDLLPINVLVPGDFSGAAFFIVAALILPNSDLVIRGVGLNPLRTGLIDVLQQMGGKITMQKTNTSNGEPVGNIRVQSSQLKNTIVQGALVPRLIDEVPVLALAAAVAEGTFVLRNASELRAKETDRLKAIASELKKIGVPVCEQPDGLTIQGKWQAKNMPDQNVFFKSHGDHRMAMTQIIAGLMLKAPAQIDDIGCINTSFPGFCDLLKTVTVG